MLPFFLVVTLVALWIVAFYFFKAKAVTDWVVGYHDNLIYKGITDLWFSVVGGNHMYKTSYSQLGYNLQS